MITLLIFVGFFGMMAPWLGFMVLFIGAAFMASAVLGILSIVVTAITVLILVSINS
jgi:hypothetical protein